MGSSTSRDGELRTRVHQQEVVADLGQAALRTDDLDSLMHEACVAVAETLDNDYCKVLELLPDGEEVVLRQGVGWRDGLVGSATVPTDVDSQAGYTLITEEPVIVDDLATEERFSGPELLTSHDVVSGVSVVIGSIDDPWGVLGTHTTERTEFTEHDAAFVQSVANVLGSAIENHETRAQLAEERDMFAEGPTMVFRWEMEMDWPVGYASENVEDVLGYTKAELESREVTYTELLLEEEFDRIVREVAENSDETTERFSHEPYRIKTKDGDVRWVKDTTKIVRDDDGRITSYLGYVVDITQRMEREEELERYRTIVEAVNDGVYVVDDDGQFTLVNEAYAEMTGYDREDLLGEHVSLVVDEAVAEQAQAVEARMRAGEADTATIEAELRTAGGEEIPAEATFAMLPGPDGETHRVGVVRDVTERKRRERELRQRERRLTRQKAYTDDILDAVDDLFYVVDDEGVFQRWNQSMCDVTGYSDAEIESMNPLDFIVEEDQEAIAEGIEEIFETGSARVEATVSTKGGDRVPMEFVASALENPDGGRVLAGIGRDISVRNRRERQLRESNERLEQFAYAASHDLQEPLRMVSSYLQLIDRRYSDVLDEDGREFLGYAVDGADRMRDMVDGLLEYSRVDTRGKPFEQVELDAVFADVREDLRVKIAETGADIAAESLPPVEGDRDQLRQVFQNLLDNAIEYSGDDPPRIHVSAEPNGDEWVLSVIDEGIGIDPEDADQIFEVFKRLHGPGEYDGTGIGLALCERIVDRHDGEIWVESDPGEGATFSFTLPAVGETDE